MKILKRFIEYLSKKRFLRIIITFIFLLILDLVTYFLQIKLPNKTMTAEIVPAFLAGIIFKPRLASLSMVFIMLIHLIFRQGQMLMGGEIFIYFARVVFSYVVALKIKPPSILIKLLIIFLLIIPVIFVGYNQSGYPFKFIFIIFSGTLVIIFLMVIKGKEIKRYYWYFIWALIPYYLIIIFTNMIFLNIDKKITNLLIYNYIYMLPLDILLLWISCQIVKNFDIEKYTIWL